MASIISLRRKRGAVCPRCKSPDYKCTGLTPLIRQPEFRCTSCDTVWTCGHYGEPYIDDGAPYPEGWVEKVIN
jgi:transposase-like protein